MTGSEKINAFIEAEGKGNVRDALNVALTRIELLQIEKAGLIEMLDTSEPIGSIADKIISGISAPHDQHTPTPWTASENDWYIVAKSGHICEMIGPHGYETQRANARRICAAVNFCAEMPTGHLEKLGTGGAVSHGETIKRQAIENARLRAENARLLDAAKRVSIYMGWDSHEMDSIETIGEFKTAIAEAETSEMKVVVPQQDGSAIEYDNMKEAQPAQVIANLTRKLGDAIKALRFARSVMVENGVTETSERLAIEKIDEALKPYEPSQKPTYGPGPMIQERPRQEEADGPDPCDLAREEPPEDQGWKEQQDAVSHYYRNRWK